MAAATTTCPYFQIGRSSVVASIPSKHIRVAAAAGAWRRRASSLKASAIADDRVGFNENSGGIVSGEWTETFSLLSYDDLRSYYLPQKQTLNSADPVGALTDEIDPEGIVSGEWPANFSLLCYDDLRAYYAPKSVTSPAETPVTVPVEVLDEISPEAIVSGEWPDNFSLLCYNDLKAYLAPQILERLAKRKSVLREVLSLRHAAKVDQTLEEIEHHFQVVSGLPVFDDELHCIGLVTKEDKDRAAHGLKSKVGEVVSCPPFALSADNTVLDAAAVMLKMHIENIAILDQQQLIGIVNDSDISHELEIVSV